MSTDATIHVRYARLLLQCLAQAGLDVRAIYGRADVEAIARMNGEARMTLASWDDMVSCAQWEMSGVDVALMLAEFITPMDMGTLGFFTMAGCDLRASTQALARFYPLLSDGYALEVTMSGRRMVTHMRPLTSCRSSHLERFTLGAICRHSRWLARRVDLSFDARFAFAYPGQRRIGQYQETFGGCLAFGAEDTALHRPAGSERLHVSRDGARVGELLRSQLEEDMAALHDTGPDLLAEVERAVVATMAIGDVRIEGIAGEMGLSVRTLQVRMQALGLGFRALLDKVRHAQALTLVGGGEVPLVDIAARLGFSSQSSFARAFHRWTRMSPGAYRRRHVRAAGAEKKAR